MFMRASDVFERQVQRIHELLEASAAEVTWNDRISDPDNPEQHRQVDVTIRRGQHLTLVECRQHTSPQDVTWIEELIGRRQSLGANAVVAVSSSGFTSGALAKAHRYAVGTRDLLELTEEEVRSWGRSVALTLFFYQYSDLTIGLVFNNDSLVRLDPENLRDELALFPGVQGLFNKAAEVLGHALQPRAEHVGRGSGFGIRLASPGIRLCGEPVIEVTFEGRAHLVEQVIDSPIVRAYGAPALGVHDRETVVERFPLGETSMVHDGDRIATLLDISHLQMPAFCQFRFAQLRGNEELEHEAFELIGVETLQVPGGRIPVSILGIEQGAAEV